MDRQDISRQELFTSTGRVFITVSYDPYNEWIYNNWVGYQTVENIMAGANLCVAQLKKYNCRYVLNDNQLVSGPWDHSNEWIANDWMPRAVEAGLQYFAHVVNPQTLAELSALGMHQNSTAKFHMRVFSEIREAKKWLQQSQ